MKYKECKIGSKFYRIVQCKTCGKIFNAYESGKIAGIMYNCIETSCRIPGNGQIESAPKEVASDFIKNDLMKRKHFYGIEKTQFENLFDTDVVS